MIVQFKKSMLLLLIFTGMQSASFAQSLEFEMTQIGSNNLLDTPWDLQFGPDGYLWITEKHNGVVLRVNPENGTRDELIKLADLSSSGGQDGLLGFAFHKDFDSGSPYIYLSYTHSVSGSRKQQIVRYTYAADGEDGSLSSPMVLIDGLPSSNDHQSGRLVYGPDDRLYYTIGDQGVKDCPTNLAQFLPTQNEVDQKNWSKYPGSVLRLELDGSIPADNPVLDGVRSHIFSYGHRNAQGLVFGSNGILYSDEHGPSSDDEINIIESGKNYGWPFVAGIRDNKMYDSDGCLTNETSFDEPNYQDPLLSMFLPDAYRSPSCTDSWMCRPNIAPSSIEIYDLDVIPGWKNALLVTSLKKGRLYKVQLDESGTAVVGEPEELFYTSNRYRDIAIDPDGKSIYLITDNGGKTADASGMNISRNMKNPGAILKFTYQEEEVTSVATASTIKFNVWPNPVSSSLFIELENTNELQISIELVNTMGQVSSSYGGLVAGVNEINLNDLAAGIYILYVRGAEGIAQQRIIIE
jgi:glucose/arabinose dehydrogenase